MLGTHDLEAFLLASLALSLTPGPDTMYILARTVSQGRAAGLMSVLGITCGCLVHTFFAAVGLSAILATSATAFTVVKTAGAAYLIWLGIQALRRRPSPEGHATLAPDPHLSIFRQGLLTNVLNPKVALFFLALLPQFVVPNAGLGPLPFLLLGAIFMAIGLSWCVVLVLAASRATRLIRRNERVMHRLEQATGLVFIALGLNLLRAKPA